MPKPPDDNDLAQRGELPIDPFAEMEEVGPEEASSAPSQDAEASTEDAPTPPPLAPGTLLSALAGAALARIERRMRGDERPIQTPWPDLNAQLQGGFWPGVHVLISGTGAGKSQLALETALAAATAQPPEHPAAIGYVALELDEDQVLARVAAPLTGLDWSRIYRGELAPHELARVEQAFCQLTGLPFYLDAGEPSGWPAQRIEAMAAALRQAHPDSPALLLVDFLQLVGSDLDDRGRPRREDLRERIGRAAYTARQAARRHRIAIVLISSTARANYNLVGDDPKAGFAAAGLSVDLLGQRRILNPDVLVGLGKETGEIEYAADSVTVMARLSFERLPPVELPGFGRASAVVVATAKLRAGPPSWCVLGFTGQRFAPWSGPALDVVEALKPGAAQRNEASRGDSIPKVTTAGKAPEKLGRYD